MEVDFETWPSLRLAKNSLDNNGLSNVAIAKYKYIISILKINKCL